MAKETYPFKEIEPKRQKAWEEEKSFEAPSLPSSQEKKFYCLVMFPYPSGRLHMGHVRNYTIGDVIARYKRLCGFEVLHPIGWDAFGLPAENAAIKNKIHPEAWTRQNIQAMREQLKSLGISYDWSREFATCDPEYYRWNQWIFLQMFKKGLAVRKKSPVNFCPGCRTVLANEQVTQEGACWRCDSQVIQKELYQWFLRITEYAEDLLQGHKLLKDQWPSQVVAMQQNWIGRSEGALADFEIIADAERIMTQKKITVFTTRPDTLFGSTFMAISCEHPLAAALASRERKEAVLRFLQQGRPKRGEGREGIFTGSYAMNPVNGEKIPIYAAAYVLMEYGTGAIMAVPAHDQRDFEFAREHGLPIRQVVLDPKAASGEASPQAYEGEGALVNSGKFNGLLSEDAKWKIVEWLASQGKAKRVVQYKLKDWLISRQRAWGTPIPVVYCEKCEFVPVAEKDLPVLLPANAAFTGTGESPLAKVPEFLHAVCPRCGGPAQRETDTMDTFVDSSWYYARYLDPKNSRMPFVPDLAKAWLPVDLYIGGIEHACMHLIYSRFFHKFLKKEGLFDNPEPFRKLVTQGMVTLGGAAMSKSKGNIVDPQEIIEKYGADTARLFILFAAPVEKSLEWSYEGVEGCFRFLNRVWRLIAPVQRQIPTIPEKGQTSRLLYKWNSTVQKVTEDVENCRLNTAIAALMELVNELYTYGALGDEISRRCFQDLLVLIYPFAPHFAEEAWQKLGPPGSILKAPWPAPDPRYLAQEEVEIAVQVNGKVRDRLRVAVALAEPEVQAKVMALPKVQEALSGKTVVKFVFVPNRLLNIVVQEKGRPHD